LNNYKNSIAGFLYDNEVLFIGNEISNGKEIWDFITTKNKINDIVDGLSSMGKIVDIKIKNCPRFIPQLSSSQLKVLKYALKNGYLDYPRIMDASELSKKLGISKITFLYHLRSAERKLIEFYLDYIDDEYNSSDS
jgi:predicted DNA binding protein